LESDSITVPLTVPWANAVMVETDTKKITSNLFIDSFY